MKTLYTAIGKFECRTAESTSEYPVIMVSGKEYMMDPQELILWNALSWRILNRSNIGHYYNAAIQKSEFHPSRSLEDCLNRLISRGLVISGSGDTEYDALYSMIAALNILPATGSFLVKIIAFCKLSWKYGLSLKTARFIFRKDSRTATEALVMSLVNQTQLSTAEVIKCVDRNIRDIPNEEAVMDMLYHDDDTTSDNISNLMKSAHRSKDVILAISNLYLRQQIIFERI